MAAAASNWSNCSCSERADESKREQKRAKESISAEPSLDQRNADEVLAAEVRTGIYQSLPPCTVGEVLVWLQVCNSRFSIPGPGCLGLIGENNYYSGNLHFHGRDYRSALDTYHLASAVSSQVSGSQLKMPHGACGTCSKFHAAHGPQRSHALTHASMNAALNELLACAMPANWDSESEWKPLLRASGEPRDSSSSPESIDMY